MSKVTTSRETAVTGKEAYDPRARSARFRDNFVIALGVASAVYCMLAITSILLTGVNRPALLYLTSGLVLGIASIAAVRNGYPRLGTHMLFIGDAAVLTMSAVVAAYAPLRGVGLMLFAILVLMVTFLEGLKIGLAYALGSSAGMALPPLLGDLPTQDVILVVATQTFATHLAWICGAYAEKYQRSGERALAKRIDEMEAVVEDTQRIAGGDLTAQEGMSPVLTPMVDELRRLVLQASDGVKLLAESSSEVVAMSRQQAAGATRQNAAIQQTRITIEQLARASGDIASTAGEVLDDARSTERTHERAEQLFEQLKANGERATEVLEIIKGVSRKSEVIALNASLEATRAGEAGKGFGLVAAEIQRLAQRTAKSVAEVKLIVDDLQKNTAVAAQAVRDAASHAGETTAKAQTITQVTQQQSEGAQQILDAMDEVASITSDLAATSDDTTAAMSRIEELSHQLADAVSRFAT